MPVIEVTAVPAFSDNYIRLITSRGNSCAIVSRGNAQPVLDLLQKQGLDLAYILMRTITPITSRALGACRPDG